MKKIPCPLEAYRWFELCCESENSELRKKYDYQNYQHEYGISIYDYINEYADEVNPLLEEWWDDLPEETKLKYIDEHITHLEKQYDYWMEIRISKL